MSTNETSSVNSHTMADFDPNNLDEEENSDLDDRVSETAEGWFSKLGKNTIGKLPLIGSYVYPSQETESVLTLETEESMPTGPKPTGAIAKLIKLDATTTPTTRYSGPLETCTTTIKWGKFTYELSQDLPDGSKDNGTWDRYVENYKSILEEISKRNDPNIQPGIQTLELIPDENGIQVVKYDRDPAAPDAPASQSAALRIEDAKVKDFALAILQGKSYSMKPQQTKAPSPTPEVASTIDPPVPPTINPPVQNPPAKPPPTPKPAKNPTSTDDTTSETSSVSSVELSDPLPDDEENQLPPIGLTNRGNTCFANTLIQLIASYPALRDEISNNKDPRFLWRVALEQYNGERKTPNKKVSFLDTSIFAPTGKQECILAKYDEITKSVPNLQNTTISTYQYQIPKDIDISARRDLVRESDSTTVTQTDCEEKPGLLLRMPMDNQGKPISGQSLEQIIRSQNTMPKKINAFTQIGATKYPRTEETTLLAGAPQVLAIHVNRQYMDKGKLTKNEAKVDLPERFNLPEESCSDPKGQNGAYQLRGFAVHNGTATNGHYIAYVKIKGQDDETHYYEINDNKSTEIPPSLFLEKGENFSLAFYDKISNDTASESSDDSDTSSVTSEDAESSIYEDFEEEVFAERPDDDDPLDILHI